MFATMETENAEKPLILIVEDEPAIQSILVDSMRQAFNTLRAADGEAALAMINALQSVPDVVLTDVNMPRMDGFELARALRDSPRTADVPILMLTGNANREFKLKALDFGINDYLTKPFDTAEVAIRARNLAKLSQAQRFIAGYAVKLETDVAERTRALEETLLKLMQTHEDLVGARGEAVHILGVACEYRDDETASHIRRMAYYTRAIAESMNLDRDYVQQLEAAAPMHDIGKIGVPDSILLKPGKLTNDEFKIMQQHPGIGARILSQARSPLLREARDIALYHHEKWDGTGYPRGIAGEAIPLSARIVALSDVFDALTQKRVYKPAFSLKQSLEMIDGLIGTHFDPDVVKAFKRNLDAIVEIRDKYTD